MRVARAARGCVGTRFRLHGREVAGGLDCVGVVAVALRAGGYGGPVPGDYRLRTGAVRFDFARAGLATADGRSPGDVIVARAGAGQVHLVVRTDLGFVHADASLRRVVERPGPVPWPMLGAWRLGEG